MKENFRSNNGPICPNYKTAGGIVMRADAVPVDSSNPSSGVALFTTFSCRACDCILDISWAPHEIAANLSKSFVH